MQVQQHDARLDEQVTRPVDPEQPGQCGMNDGHGVAGGPQQRHGDGPGVLRTLDDAPSKLEQKVLAEKRQAFESKRAITLHQSTPTLPARKENSPITLRQFLLAP
mgnify:CR=1 FL=1